MIIKRTCIYINIAQDVECKSAMVNNLLNETAAGWLSCELESLEVNQS